MYSKISSHFAISDSETQPPRKQEMNLKHWITTRHTRKVCDFPRFTAVAACVRYQKKLWMSKLPTAFSATGPVRLIDIKNIGVTGFEPAASWSQTRRSSQAEPPPAVHCTDRQSRIQIHLQDICHSACHIIV